VKAYVCNKCGRVITNKDIMKRMIRIEFNTNNIGKYEEMHLCDDCKDKVIKYIREEE
jgi:NAD-dependent SIR2 family protein deacetylase